jgi:hypothetical protein
VEGEYRVPYQNAEAEDRNELTKAVLKLCQKMLEFAFYTERNQLVDLLNVLLVLINGYSDITVEEEIEYIAKLNNYIYGDKSLIKS